MKHEKLRKMRNHLIPRYILSVLIIGTMLCCVQSSGLALTNEEVFSQFRFNFITPGARATAFGGAFIGLADDATAVESNPAGLTVLTAPEISVELKDITYTAEQMYENSSPETEIEREEFDDVVKSVPFVSVVYPYERFVLSLYRQESVNYKSSYRTSPNSISITGTDWVNLPIDASVELGVTNYGIGVSVQLIEGLSLAVSPRWAEMKMTSHSFRFGLNNPYPTDFSADDIHLKSTIDDEVFEFSINTGILWKIHPKISVGAVYRSGPTFTVTETLVNRDTGFVASGDLAEFTLKVPDSFGAGIGFRATDFLIFMLDVVHIRYEDLLEDFDILFGEEAYTKENYTVDNATEVHVGAEYILPLGERFLALRAGVYNDPDHTIRFTGTTGNPSVDLLGKALFPGGDDQIHVTGGVGLVVNNHFQIDSAADIADKHTQFSLSAVYRF